MKKKIGLVVNVNLQTKGMLGIKNKTIGQAKGFSSNGVIVSLFCCDGPALVRLLFLDGQLTKTEVLLSAIKPGAFFLELATLFSEKSSQNDYWYFRYIPMTDESMVLCAEKCRSETSKVYFEVPTFPYHKELSTEWAETDRLLQDKLQPYVSGVFSPSFTENNSIFLGHKIKKISNGVDFDLIPPLEKQKDTTAFCLIGVGWISNWHGYDRVIKSIPEFISKHPDIRFCFYIVGDGPAKINLQQLVESLGLGAYICFTGALTGKALDDIYKQCSLGVASLGLHRLDPNGTFEVLKVREYLARGFPMLISHNDSFDYSRFPGLYRTNGDEGFVNLSFFYQKVSFFWQSEGPEVHAFSAKEIFSYKEITKNILSFMAEAGERAS